MKTNNNYYLEMRAGNLVLKRIETTLASEYRDRELLEEFKPSNQHIYFVVSLEKEPIIN